MKVHTSPWGMPKPPLEPEEIKRLSDTFSEKTFISRFQCGTLYRARHGDKEVTVKVYDEFYNDMPLEFNLYSRGEFKGHPKVITYSIFNIDYPSVMVFDLNPLDTVHNLIPKATLPYRLIYEHLVIFIYNLNIVTHPKRNLSCPLHYVLFLKNTNRDNFSWSDRIKVALGFAETLRSLHQPTASRYPFMLRNIDAAHILCDQEYTPILYDYQCITGGLFINMGMFGGVPLGSYGYTDPCATEGECSVKGDVFAFGVILLGLLSKRVVNAEKDKESDFVNKWAEKEYSQKMKQGIKRPSLVEESLTSHPYYYPEDGRKLTWWAMECIKYVPDDRPSMAKLVKILKSLTTIQNHGDEIGVKKMLERL